MNGPTRISSCNCTCNCNRTFNSDGGATVCFSCAIGKHTEAETIVGVLRHPLSHVTSTVTSVEELEALPEDTVVLAGGWAWQKVDGDWFGHAHTTSLTSSDLARFYDPATVLTPARDDVPALLDAVNAALSVIRDHREASVGFTPGFRDGLDQMANDIELAITKALGVEG